MEFKLLSEINYNMEFGNYVNLPSNILEELNSESKELPYFFEINTESCLKSYVGVKQFTAEKDTIEIPQWLSEHLGINGNQILNVKLLENVPKGKYVNLRPETEDFFEIPDYESCLETKLSDFPLLHQGQVIQIDIFDKPYKIKIEEIEHDWELFDFDKGTDSLELNVIDVINTDINVDIFNIFLKKRLEEEVIEKQKQQEIQDELAKQAQKERVLQKGKCDDVTEEVVSVFNSNGNKINNEDDNKKLSIDEVRLARLKFYNMK